jgi:hypothetical protein
MKMGKIENLPKWAQRRIRKLENDVKWLEDQLATAKESGGKITWSLSETGGGLPDSATINFNIEGTIVSIDIGLDGNLRLIAHDRIAIFPDASNSLKIGVVK